MSTAYGSAVCATRHPTSELAVRCRRSLYLVLYHRGARAHHVVVNHIQPLGFGPPLEQTKGSSKMGSCNKCSVEAIVSWRVGLCAVLVVYAGWVLRLDPGNVHGEGANTAAAEVLLHCQRTAQASRCAGDTTPPDARVRRMGDVIVRRAAASLDDATPHTVRCELTFAGGALRCSSRACRLADGRGGGASLAQRRRAPEQGCG